ncbi:MAG: hypothetical protein K2M31_01935 [Muribaculaceae bacterium]|nr:hypothetical protein [Muribaculaceae bacterium]
MKKIKAILLAVAVLAGCMGVSAKKAWGVVERKAQTEVQNYLKAQGFETEIDDEDHALLFRQSGIVYWITFESDNTGGGVLYTLHRTPIKLIKDGDSKDKISRITDVMAVASNIQNKEYAYKTYAVSGRAYIEFPIYASTPTDYIKQLRNVLESMENAQKDYQASYKQAEQQVDSLRRYWSSNDPGLLVLPQAAADKAYHKGLLTLQKVTVGSVDAKGQTLVDFEGMMKRDLMKFIVEKVTVTAKTSGEYLIGVKIYNPQNRLIVSAKGQEYTVSQEVKISKAEKEQTFTLPVFGTEDSNFWMPGDYRIEVYGNGEQIGRKTFNIDK